MLPARPTNLKNFFVDRSGWYPVELLAQKVTSIYPSRFRGILKMAAAHPAIRRDSRAIFEVELLARYLNRINIQIL